MKKRLCLLALCLAALLGLSLFFVACDDEPAPGPTPTPVEHKHSYTSVTIAVADYMGMEGADAGKFIKDVAVPCSGEDCDSTLTLTKDELNAVFAAIMEDEDAADYTAKVEGGNDITSFKVTKGEYTVTVNVTQPHTHLFNAVTISFDEYIDTENATWKKPLEVPCYDSPRGCTDKLTFTVEELYEQREQEPVPVDETTIKLTLTKDGHTVTVTVTGVPASEGPGEPGGGEEPDPDEPGPTPQVQYSVGLNIGENAVNSGGSSTLCVGSSVAYAVTMTKDGNEVTDVNAEASAAGLSAFYTIGGGNSTPLNNVSGNFIFGQTGIYEFSISVTGDTFTYTVEVRGHSGTYYAATSATCTEYGTVAYIHCNNCEKYFHVTGTAGDYTVGKEFDYNNEGIINQADPAKGHSYTAVKVAYSDVSTDRQWEAEVACGNGCNEKLTLTMNAFDTADGWTLDTENGYQAPSHNADGQGNYYKSVEEDGYNVKVTVTGVVIPQLPHTMAHTEATVATCTAAGNYEYWYCSGCQTYYKDEIGSEAYDDQAATVIPIDENAHAWAQEWSTDETSHWYACTNDGCTVKKEEAAHTWGYTASNGEGHYQTCGTCGYAGAQQEHVGSYTYDVKSKDVLFTCNVCNGTVDCEITGIDVTAETGAYIVDNGDGTYTAYGFTVEAVYGAVSGNEVTEIIIPAEDWTATPQGSYKAAVEFACGTLKDTPDGTFAVYADELDPLPSGVQTLSGYQPTAITLGSFKGEFVYHIELDGTVAGTASYESWLIQVTAGNGALAVLRADNYVLDNFGRKADELGADVNELDSFVGTGDPIRSGDIVIDIVRTFDVASGIYKLEFTVTDGINVSTYTITEPATNGNSVTVYLGGENCSYTVAGALYAEKGLTVKSVQAPAEPVNVSGGTSLADALQNVTVTVSYTESTLTDTVAASACAPVCADYDADTTGDYIVTLTYGGKTTQVTIHVDAEHVHDFVDGVCSCGARSLEVVSGGTTYTSVLTSTPITNNDTSGEWYDGTTSDLLMNDGDAVILTWSNSRDPHYFDFFVEMYFNPDGLGGDGQFLDLSNDSAWSAEWTSATAPVGNEENVVTTGTVTPVPEVGEAGRNSGFGTYKAVVYRISTDVTMRVEFTPDASIDIPSWTREITFTGCPTGVGYLRIAGNPYWLDNITAYAGTLEAQA